MVALMSVERSEKSSLSLLSGFEIIFRLRTYSMPSTPHRSPVWLIFLSASSLNLPLCLSYVDCRSLSVFADNSEILGGTFSSEHLADVEIDSLISHEVLPIWIVLARPVFQLLWTSTSYDLGDSMPSIS